VNVIAEPCRYQLRAYIYQGRDLLSGDSSGLSGNCSLTLCCQYGSTFITFFNIWSCSWQLSQSLWHV